MDRVATVICLKVSSWVTRFKLDLPQAKDDLKWTAFISVWVFRHELLRLVIQFFWQYAWGIPIFLAIYAASLLGVFDQGLEQRVSSKADNNSDNVQNRPLKPLLFPCRTSHTRFFPKKHSFSYSYLFVGIPVGWRGSIGSLLSADLEMPLENKAQIRSFSDGRKGWFRVESMDHLERGFHPFGLQGKLHAYLRSQEENPDSYPNAYLVTAPRFLGYSFNPVSFWYLYGQEMDLKAMILEVNNTFDERRMYFLKGSVVDNSLHSSNKRIEGQQDPTEPKSDDTHAQDMKFNGGPAKKFTDTWLKDFHVSPFNSRKGSYALSASNPLFSDANTKGPINNVINLNSSKEHSKLVARVYSTEDARDPVLFSPMDTFRFLAAWWWVGFVTFSRIIREARKLFFWRKLHVWYRPEISKDSIGRQATSDEIVIGKCFSSFLRDRVEHSDLRTPVRFNAALPQAPNSEVYVPHSLAKKPVSIIDDLRSEENVLELKILTPLFYDRLVRYAHISEFLHIELLEKDDDNRMLWTLDPATLLELFHEKSRSNQRSLSQKPSNHFDRARWSTLRKLRRSRSLPRMQTPSNMPTGLASKHLDIRSFPFSSLDEYVMKSEDAAQAHLYRRTVTKFLISEYIAFGIPQLITAFDTIVGLLLCYTSVNALYQLFATEDSSRDVRFGRLILSSNGIHLWRLLETYL